jgi:hypothetical protein
MNTQQSLPSIVPLNHPHHDDKLIHPTNQASVVKDYDSKARTATDS